MSLVKMYILISVNKIKKYYKTGLHLKVSEAILLIRKEEYFMKWKIIVLFPLFVFVSTCGLYSQSRLESVFVKTRAKENSRVTIYYRVPSNYDCKGKKIHRVLVIFGGRNNSGKEEARGRLGWGKWADENGIFLVSPGFKNDEYWQPDKWSGRALFTALGLIKKKYRICDTKLLYYGYSGGAQCSNLFPAWRPGCTRAWVSHASGVFHDPSPKMRSVPGLVTCGDADLQRYIISRKFVEDSRLKGVNIIWKSYPNHPHDVPPDSLNLARSFLEYYHNLYLEDLKPYGRAVRSKEGEILYVGDDQDQVVYEANTPEAVNILPEDRVYFTSEQIARAWSGGK